MKIKNFYYVFLVLLIGSSIGCPGNNSQLSENPREQTLNKNTANGESKSSHEELFFRKLISYADTTHSSIEFRTRHSGVYDVIGWIQSFNIVMEGRKKDFTDIVVEASADIRTVKMPNPGMAVNLQGLFDTENYPKAYFKSTGISEIRINKFMLNGEMTIKDITKRIDLEVMFNGFGVPLTSGMPGFTVDGAFNRFDFNIGERGDIYSETPNPLLGDSIFFKGNLRMFYDIH